MAINFPVAYSKLLDRAFKLKSLTEPGFKGEYQLVGGTTKTFKIYAPVTVELEDYSSRKSAKNSATFGYQYRDAENTEQTVTASQDKYFALNIDKGDAKFSVDGSLDARTVMKAQIEEQVVPMIDKYNLSVLAGAGTALIKATTTANAYETFNELMIKQTNDLVPAKGRVAFVSATEFGKLKLDPKFTVPSELTAHSRRTGNYGMIDGCLIIQVPDSYLPSKVQMILTHEKAAAAPKILADYNQGPFKESASGYYVNGRVIHEAFIFKNKEKAVQVLKAS